MKNEKDLLLKLAKNQWLTTNQLDTILQEWHGNIYDANMHCNSLMRRGFIDYCSDGDWKILISIEDLE
jgi:hypothetical protein